MLALREFRDRAEGLPDLLNWAALVDEGIILNKDGSLMTGWFFAGPDMESASNAELAALSAQVNAALARLGTGWMIHVDLVRKPSVGYPEGGAFPDPTTAVIDAERRQQYLAEGAHYESAYVLTVTYLPPPDAARKAAALFVDDGQGGAGRRGGHDRVLTQFRRAADDLEGALSARLAVARMTSADLLTHLHGCLTGERHPVRVPPAPMYLDAILASRDFYGGLRPRIGDRHIRVVGVCGYPLESYPAILDWLSRLPAGFRWSTRFIPLDPVDAEAELKKYRRSWFAKRQGMMGILRDAFGAGGHSWDNTDAIRMAGDADEAIAEASEGAVRYGFLTQVVVLMDADEARVDDAAKAVAKELGNHGFPARVEDVNSVEAFLGSLPGHGVQNVRRPLMHTLNLADLLPLTSVWPGLEEHPCPFYPDRSPPLLYAAAAGATPFRLTLHVGDVGHTLVLGPTGSGKSTLIGLIAAQHFRYPGAQVFAFDKGYSLLPLAYAAGGDHYDIAGEHGGVTFYPLGRIHESSAERAWACEWIETLCALQGVQIGPGHRHAIHEAVQLLARSESRTLTDLTATLQHEALRQALEPYTLSGAVGSLLDAERDGLRDGRFQVFELEHLMGLSDRYVAPVLLYLFHRIEQRLTGSPTLIVLDEAWLMLDHPLFRERIREWLKVLRKRNAAVVFATQSIADVMNSPIRDTIIESCPTKILLADAEARHHAELYARLGMTPRQVELITTATPKRHYYYVSPLGRRLLDLGLGPVALSFVGASGSDDIRRVRELRESYGEEWPAYWLAERGLAEWAEYWRRQRGRAV